MDSFPLQLKPDAITNISSEFNTKITKYENGVEQRVINWHGAKKAYKLEWRCIDNGLESQIISFFNSQYGQGKSWLFSDNRLSGDLIVRFNSDKLSIDKINAKFSNIQVEIITC